jgi:hypothetical protein
VEASRKNRANNPLIIHAFIALPQKLSIRQAKKFAQYRGFSSRHQADQRAAFLSPGFAVANGRLAAATQAKFKS